MKSLTEIAVRAYVKTESRSYTSNQIEIPNFTRILVVDTETTADQYQNLLFGSYVIYDGGVKVDEGIFYNPEFVSKKDLQVLKKCSEKIISVRKFVDGIFLPEIYDAQTLCVGFNLPFDLSRLAIDFGYGRKSNRGSFSFKLTENKKHPRLIIKHIDSTKSFIKFGTSGLRRQQYQGNFLDLRTLSFALSSGKHTLESACEFFKSPVKKHSIEKHGKITPKYVRYNLNDLDATYHLYLKLCLEYEKYGLFVPMTKIYSPASLGKAYLDAMGVQPFYQISKVSLETLGKIMVTYYGGRTEVRIRKYPIKIRYLDFLSMYPTVCILLGLWRFIIAKEIIEEDCTEWTKEFLDKIQLDDLNNQNTWKNLAVIVCIKPDNDILPIRSKYGNKYAYNIGINYASYDREVWYCLADVIASKLLTGKTPKIIKAIRFVPNGIQNLKLISILGRKTNPTKQDFFKEIIEHRQELRKKDDPKEYILKIIANATSYGIYAQINTENQKAEVDVYGLEHFLTSVDKIEKQGKRFNPILASLITSGSRLILAMVEAILTRHGSTHAFCDTDSMAIPAGYVDEVQSFFQKLNPYNFDRPLFKLEEENFVDGKLTDLWFYGISSKRYVLYNYENDKIQIRKYSSHGLGHIKNPFSIDSDWQEEFWKDVLEFHYGKKSIKDINEKYSDYYAVSELAVSTPNLMRRFAKLNKRKSYEQKIKPYNFCLVGFGNSENVKPLGVYKKNSQEAVFDKFIDYNTGQIMQGIQFWKSMEQIFWDYVNHSESKFNGNVSILQRKNLKITNIAYIGKESNDLEESEVVGIDDETYLQYQNEKIPIKKILNLTPKEAKKCGIVKTQLYRIRKVIKSETFRFRKKTLQKLMRMV
ncbi:MAG: hypothetical protein WEC35_07645 [Nitrosopumilaceae archaeon]